jgi:hypothetical protein
MAKQPVRRSDEIENEILTRLAAGETLRAICRSENMPDASAVVQWCDSSVGVDGGFAQRYAHARRLGLDAIAEETIAIADDVSLDPAGRRVAVDARKWLLSKMRPDKYGDRVATEISGPGGAPVQMEINAAKESLETRIAGITARLRESGDTGSDPA